MTQTTLPSDHLAEPLAGAGPAGRACCGPSCCATEAPAPAASGRPPGGADPGQPPAPSEPERQANLGNLRRPPAPGVEPERLVEAVRERYGAIAEGRVSACCGSGADMGAAVLGYSAADLATLPEGANLGLGCGAPLQFLDLQPGETVLDLGSGAGVDALLAARQVGPQGRVLGVDMTAAMLERARENTAAAGVANVEFRAGRLEALPVADAAVDAVTSNCVINLVPDKGAVFAEIARVLRPGGRLVISDILLDAPLPAALEQDLLAYVGCVAGAQQRAAYFGLVRAAGLAEPEILRDVDYLAALGDAIPAEAQALAERAGVRPQDLAGVVRSVTFRARRTEGAAASAAAPAA
ncbi:MAG TPA: arsenite methyltransferase [Thermoanaerobaculia bacterium]|nr:arsenite methyltransferase [Thermoanaerobaculia bacterium]